MGDPSYLVSPKRSPNDLAVSHARNRFVNNKHESFPTHGSQLWQHRRGGSHSARPKHYPSLRAEKDKLKWLVHIPQIQPMSSSGRGIKSFIIDAVWSLIELLRLVAHISYWQNTLWKCSSNVHCEYYRWLQVADDMRLLEQNSLAQHGRSLSDNCDRSLHQTLIQFALVGPEEKDKITEKYCEWRKSAVIWMCTVSPCAAHKHLSKMCIHNLCHLSLSWAMVLF